MSGNRHSQHLSKHRDSDLEPNPSEEADEHRLREEVGDEAQFEQSRQQQEPGRKQRDRTRQGYIPCTGYWRQAGDPTGKDGRGCGVGGNHQVAGGAEGRECHERKQQRVKASHHGHAGNLGVPHGLRDIHGRER